jgi:hypothetical protein
LVGARRYTAAGRLAVAVAVAVPVVAAAGRRLAVVVRVGARRYTAAWRSTAAGRFGAKRFALS